MKEAMKDLFDRLLGSWEKSGLGLPRAPWDPDVEPFIWQSEPDENEWAAWRPVEKTVHHDLAAVAPDLEPLHPSVQEYFNSWWFCALDGRLGEHGLSLTRVLPGFELESFLRDARGYRGAHGGQLNHVPIGMESNGWLVVVDNHSGEVLLEDFERGELKPLAPSLAELLRRLEV